MVSRVYLGLDFETEAYERGEKALAALRSSLGDDFVAANVGVKINLDAFTDKIDPRLLSFPHIFADLKIDHGSGTARRVLERIRNAKMRVELVTAAATLGSEILAEYVKYGEERGTGIVAFTVHTKISRGECLRIYGRPPEEQIPILGRIAQDAGCAAIVCEGAMLTRNEMRALVIPKLVTGIRPAGTEMGEQKRHTGLEEFLPNRGLAEYAVISHQNVERPETLPGLVHALLRD